ncbi:M16 family metallopeptidase [Pseudomonas sp. X10]
MSNTTPIPRPSRQETCEHLATATAEVDFGGLTSVQGIDLGQVERLNRNVQCWQTEGGSRVLFVQSHELPMIDLVLRFTAGGTLDGDTPGLAALTLYMLDQGTERMNGTQFAEQLEGLGATMTRSVSLEHATVALRSLSKEGLRTQAIQLLTDMVARPAFDSSELERIKERLLSHLRHRDTDTDNRIQNETLAHLFAGHPYATYYAGTPQGVAGVTRDMLRTFHQRAYSANNVEIALVGDLSREQAETIIDAISQALPQGWAAAELPRVPVAEAKTLHVEHPGSSDKALLALPLNISSTDPDFPALVMANEILGGGADSRLMAQLRHSRGLTYSVLASLVPFRAGGLFKIEWDIAAAHKDASHELVLQVLRCFIQEGPSQAELDLALSQLAGEQLKKTARNDQLAKILVEISHQGLPSSHLSTYLDTLAQLTTEHVRQALQRWFDLERLFFISIGPTADQQPLPAPQATDQ